MPTLWPFHIDHAAVGGLLRRLAETIYWQGVKDGAIVASVALILIYLLTSSMKPMRIAGLTVLVGVLLWWGQHNPMPPAPSPCPGPNCPIKPAPRPEPRPKKPRPKPCPGPWCPQDSGAVVPHAGKASVGNEIAPDGTEIQLDLPHDLHLKNRGGSDGAGLCVFASNSHTGVWQNEPVFSALFRYMWDHPGGGYPEKFKRIVAAVAKKLNLPAPEYMQHEGSDLELLKLACRTGRMPGVTYSYSPSGRYNGQRIAHMVSLVSAGLGTGPDGKGWWAVLDNNFPGTIEWMSEDEFRRTFSSGSGGGWATILTEKAGPPPPPHN